MLQSTQTTGGQTYGFVYAYDLTGALKSEMYPSGRVIATQYDKAERPVLLTGAWNSQQKTYASNFNYAPHGGANWFLYGNNVCRAFTYNSRLQPWTMLDSVVPGAAPGGNCTYPGDERLVQVFDWGATNNSGNLNMVTTSHGIPGNPFLTYKDHYFYDSVNRLSNVSGTDENGNLLWAENFEYDRYGNAWTRDMPGLSYTMLTPRTNVFTNGNQLSMGSYDAAGNQMVVGSYHLTYDAENRQTKVEDQGTLSNGSTFYQYDANGQRVAKARDMTGRIHGLQLRPDTWFTVLRAHSQSGFQGVNTWLGVFTDSGLKAALKSLPSVALPSASAA